MYLDDEQDIFPFTKRDQELIVAYRKAGIDDRAIADLALKLADPSKGRGRSK